MLSAVILTHNSAQTIEKALESVSWCDDIVVIDDQSKDTTLELVKKYKAHIYVHPLEKDFAKQRNFALTKAKGDWVLFIDSDEVIPPPLRTEIQEAVKKNIAAGFYFTRKDFIWGRGLSYGETAHVKLLRLAKKNAGKWERPVHEIWHVSGPTKILQHPLHHFPHHNVAQFLDSINWYSTLNAEYLALQKAVVPWWHIPGYPIAKFLRNYLFLQGFRDGTAGAIVAIMMSMHSYLTRAKLWQLTQQKS